MRLIDSFLIYDYIPVASIAKIVNSAEKNRIKISKLILSSDLPQIKCTKKENSNRTEIE